VRTAANLLLPAAHARHFAVLASLVALLFALVYVSADWITTQHPVRLHLFLPAELSIPLVPAMVVPYATMYVIFGLVPFVLRTREELDRLALALGQVIAAGGLMFILLPAELGYPPPSGGTVWAPLLQVADRINLDYNLVPSLHVALAVACAGAFLPRAPVVARFALGAWVALVALSTLLTHQHHVVDVVAGLALGAWGARIAVGQRGTTRSRPLQSGWTDAKETSKCSR
jgi:membrane-associated phospholipid phosphatase